MRAVAGENLFIPGGCLAASAGSGAEPQGWILHEHPRKPSPYVNIRTSNRVITLTQGKRKDPKFVHRSDSTKTLKSHRRARQLAEPPLRTGTVGGVGTGGEKAPAIPD